MKKTTNKLPIKFKKAWVKALRSGKYIQGQYYLKIKASNSEEVGYCCLGVACEVAKVKTRDYQYFISKSATKIPPILRGENDLTLKLSTFNDDGLSFKWIAAYIERYL